MGLEHLFSKYDWHSVEYSQRDKMQKELMAIDGNRLLNTSTEDLCDYFEKQYTINVPIIHEDEIAIESQEIDIDVSNDRGRDFSSYGPHYMRGTMVKIHIPFTGDKDVFYVQPTTFTTNPPGAKIYSGYLMLEIKGVELTKEKIQSETGQTISSIARYLETLRGNVSNFNNSIRENAHQAIENRKAKLLKDKDLVADLGFKIKEKGGGQNTYIAPEIKRKITPTMPQATTDKYTPEPTLENKDYEHILKVMQNMTHVMEQSPNAFKKLGEEDIRTHFLVQLNGHYEGQATGETFNYSGKTDILIRSNDKNIFIGECKFWGGSKKLLETIDQILGYTSWRDTKVAVIIFNKNKDFTKVLEEIQKTTKEHSNFKREDVSKKQETIFRYVFAHKDDRNREMFLTVMAFDIPK